MGLIPQIFISDPVYPECTEIPASPAKCLCGRLPWERPHGCQLSSACSSVGLANKQVRSLHLGQGTPQCSTMMKRATFHCRQRRQQVVRPKSAHPHDLAAIDRKDIWCEKKKTEILLAQWGEITGIECRSSLPQLVVEGPVLKHWFPGRSTGAFANWAPSATCPSWRDAWQSGKARTHPAAILVGTVIRAGSTDGV